MVSFHFFSLVDALKHYVGVILFGFRLFKIKDFVAFACLTSHYRVREGSLAEFTVYDDPLEGISGCRRPCLLLLVQPLLQALNVDNSHGAATETRPHERVVCA